MSRRKSLKITQPRHKVQRLKSKSIFPNHKEKAPGGIPRFLNHEKSHNNKSITEEEMENSVMRKARSIVRHYAEFDMPTNVDSFAHILLIMIITLLSLVTIVRAGLWLRGL